ncbi:histidinol-phosphate transaminase [Aestuariibacter sp. A3R04]|uniref:histidinol-phosphate transaminase n=1 Tax=Aestuariibacter sp. A3R04 TaxID=2841571 RepID=UPI001C0990E6|nr:histidinol-phosphate transaminase [Aestuariibacter sp. A3R04]MBU3023353.1 histidinol-phosphate transaminase [Aestuariibacter sp. A3R04]
MSALVDGLINDNLIPLKPYESARRLYAGGQDWLNANESPFANPYDVDASNFNRYPSCQPEAVVSNYAKYAGVADKQLIVTRGADEGIELLIRTFCTPGKDNILICPPTYGMYAISAETCDIGIKKVPLNADFSLDVDAICSTDDVNLVFICAPNNPTGTSVNEADLTRVLNHFTNSALVVVDEAYIEFDASSTWAGKLDEFSNLVILRTLSKAFALAGLRCGFALANEDVIGAMMKVIAPYPIPEPVAQIAANALSKENIVRLHAQVDILNTEKQRLRDALAAIEGFTLVGDTKANFVLFHYEASSALMAYLVSQGMLIRDQSKQMNLNHCLRATVGSPEQNDRLMALINTFMSETGASM